MEIHTRNQPRLNSIPSRASSFSFVAVTVLLFISLWVAGGGLVLNGKVVLSRRYNPFAHDMIAPRTQPGQKRPAKEQRAEQGASPGSPHVQLQPRFNCRSFPL